MVATFAAHTPPDGEPEKWQSMIDHTNNVAALAAEFAAPFGAEEIARWAGLLHDVGKYSDEFQLYLRDCAAGIPRRPGSAEHKCAGTKLGLDLLPPFIRQVVAPCVLGHHGGLSKPDGIRTAVSIARSQPALTLAIQRAYQELPDLYASPKDQVPEWSPLSRDQKTWAIEMLIRFVFSCLVDADSLDTQAHFDPSKADLRQSVTLHDVGLQWLETLQMAQERMPTGGVVNEVRREVYEACLAAAQQPPGVFSLTVPTGGGKTRSSLAFALAHAVRHERKRIIYAIPYTSIIDQTAAVFRNILGPNAVLEHHSASDPRVVESEKEASASQQEDSREQRRRLAAENWDAPLIVTTTVQFFESLFTNKTSRARKLHNIAGSVVILDEVQTLPGPLLAPLLDGLWLLVEQYGVTCVLCTATQPALIGRTHYLDGLPTAVPIVAEPAAHFAALRRVTYRVSAEPWSWAQVAEEMRTCALSCLTVVNTKKDALALLDALNDPNARHLSTLLCGAHRRVVLEEVRTALRKEREEDGPPIRLVATQVIEAGVDVDFPRVLRAKGPLDRVIQAAGRCNRENLRERQESEVAIFDPLEGRIPPKGEYATATALAWSLLTGPEGCDLDSPEIATKYFAKLYDMLGRAGLDEKCVQEARAVCDFPEVAQKVRLIDEDTVSVLVPYNRDECDRLREAILSRAENKLTMTRDLWRQLQPHAVSVYRRDIAGLGSVLEPLIEDHLYTWTGIYDSVVGIGRAVAHDPADLITT